SAITSACEASNCRPSSSKTRAIEPSRGEEDSPLFVGWPFFPGPLLFCRSEAMSLKATIVDDMKAAMRAREAARLSTIRLLLAAIKQKEVDERIDVTDH